MALPNPAEQLTHAAQNLKVRAFQATLLLDDLRQTLDSRRVIGMALGLLMSEYKLHEDAAMEVLRRRAADANLSLGQMAAEMVDDADDRGLRLPPAADC